MTVHQAPAKLTWFLEVTKTRDTGWHELRSEMVTLSLCDELDIDETSDYVSRTWSNESRESSIALGQPKSRSIAD